MMSNPPVGVDRLRMAITKAPKVQVVALIAILALPCGPARAQPLPSASPEQLKREIQKLEAEIERLRTSPEAPQGWKERMQLEDKLEALRHKRWQEDTPLRTRLVELRQMPEVAEWQDSINELGRRVRELQDLDRRLTLDAGVRLFHVRHAELAKRAPQTPELRKLGFDVLSYPRIDGSTSTQPLAVLITSRYFDVPYEWVSRGQSRPRIQPESEGDPFNPDLVLPGMWPEPEAELFEFTLQARLGATTNQRLALVINKLLATNASTHQAYLNLIEGRSDIGLLARRPSPAELKVARAKKVELQVTPCALDALVFLVHRDNPIRSLTPRQIRDIYSGKVNRWEDVGGSGGAITAYQREENSGSQQLMKELVMKGLPFKPPPYGDKDERADDLRDRILDPPQLIGRKMTSPFLSLTHDEKGLGYSVDYYERYMSGSPRTRTIAVDGIEPNPKTIGERTYPLVSEVFVVTRQGPAGNAPAARLRAWLLSPEGQSVVAASGYVPVSRGPSSSLGP
jgi:ABC-type phosphate transport system substrate-binding protein